jgi:hypothetical protein
MIFSLFNQLYVEGGWHNEKNNGSQILLNFQKLVSCSAFLMIAQ